jgi:ATP synthase protein I
MFLPLIRGVATCLLSAPACLLLLPASPTVGDQGLAAGMNSAIGQPRLLIPVVLALTYNRWNTLYADDYGVTLNLYGMLIGFFTYKFAVIGRQGLQLLSDLSAPPQEAGSSSGQSGGAEGGSGKEADDAMSLDRIFVRKVMSE